MLNNADQIRLSQLLNSVAIPAGGMRFGGFSANRVARTLSAHKPPVLPEIHFSDNDDAVITKTFERMREGLSVDRFLADPEMARSLANAVRKLQVKASDSQINRRLLAMRKATGGKKLKPTSRRDVFGDLRDRFGPGVDFAMVKLRVGHGASMDDILADPELGEIFESTARRITPGGKPVQYRICGLQIRKNRHLESNELSLFDDLDVRDLERNSQVEELQKLSDSFAPKGPGILVLREADQPLMVGAFRNAKLGASLLKRKSFQSGMIAENRFWKANPSEWSVACVTPEDVPDAPLRLWELRLIATWKPPFNWPVRMPSAA